MQSGNNKLIAIHLCKKHFSFVIIAILLPFLFWGSSIILPTFDDWTSLVSPSTEPLFSKERFFFYGYHWRPFDSIFGYIVGTNPKVLFPTLNHICVVIGHIGCTFLLYWIFILLHFRSFARNISTLFYFVTPGMMATVLAVDGLNQVYAAFWGLASLVVYISLNGNKKYILWIILVFISTLCKENGLMWAIITPLFSYGFGFIKRKVFIKYLIIGITIIICYVLMILIFPNNIEIHPEYIPSLERNSLGILKWLMSTWISVDFIYLLFEPERNIWIATITILLSLPLLFQLFISNRLLILKKPFLFLVFCLFISVSPHLVTVFSMMHTYAGLCFAAIIIAYLANYCKNLKGLKIAFVLYFISVIFVDFHLWYSSYKTSLSGKIIAQKLIQKTKQPIDKVYCIIVKENYQKLSSFCVTPSEAFGWGYAALYENNYEWPTNIYITYIDNSPNVMKDAKLLGRKKLRYDKSFDCVWIINNNYTDVLK